MRTPLLTTILAALTACTPAEDTTACIEVEPDAAECPAAADVDKDEMFSFGWCGINVRSIDGEGELQGSPWGDSGGDETYCCYPVTGRNTEPGCVVGRPFVEQGEVLAAPAVTGPAFAVGGDAVAADDWTRIARMEHASVAAFARLTLQLMALGAPADLLADVQRAAADEVEHARLAFALAARFSGRAVGPGPFPVDPAAALETDPVAVAVAAVREGCLAETVSAALAAREAARAVDPDVRAALERIADDEARHAALSWRLVAWLVRTGDAEVRQAVHAAFHAPFAVAPMFSGEDEREHAAELARVREQVLLPAWRALSAG